MNLGLEYKFSDLFRNASSPDSPEIEPPAEGLAINISDLEIGEHQTGFTLQMTGCFSETFLRQFQNIHFAPVILLQSLDGKAAAFRTIDTHKRYFPQTGPNFNPLVASSPTGRFRTFWMQIPLLISIPIDMIQPSLFITAFIHSHESNTLALDLKANTFSIRK